MQRAARVDGNQPEIVEGLRKLGYKVAITSQLKGFVDIVVGKSGNNWLFEIKDPAQPPSKRKLTPDEEKFHRDWLGQVDVIESVEDALRVIAQR